MRGKLITLEGIDNSGKSTQAKKVFSHLKRKGYPAILVREPGGTEISEKIRKILLSQKNHKMSPKTELLLYEAARAQLVEEVILPALKKGKIVICDRFYDSTTAYQAYARGLNLNLIQKLNSFASSAIVPDLTIVLDLKPEAALGRAKKTKKMPDRLEREKLRFHHKVRLGYLVLARKEPGRVKVIVGHDSVEKNWGKVKLAVDKVLNK
jgi:dTMP kinase